MRDFRDKVAVITGAASGIGLALAREAQARGAKLVVADIRKDALAEAADLLGQQGEVLAVETDVADAGAVSALAEATYARFGKAHLLVNNAGVFASGLSWEVSDEAYDWVIGVNQRSVINGIRAFVPRMIAQQEPSHVVTLSSSAALAVNPGFASYAMTKHAVLALMEALYLDLVTQGIDHIGVTIVMPGMIRSQIMQPEKTSPTALSAEISARGANPVLGALEAMMRAAVDHGLSADELAGLVFGAIETGDLYVLPAYMDDAAQGRARAVALGRATGQNPYPALIEGLLSRIRAADR